MGLPLATTQWLRGQLPCDALDAALAGRHDVQCLKFAIRFEPPRPLHDACAVPAQSFEARAGELRRFYADARRIAQQEEEASAPGWVSRSARKRIEASGAMPEPSRPIYFLTVQQGGRKAVAYIGITQAKGGRFSGGHAAITKLHHPKFQRATKELFLAAVYAQITPDLWVNLELLPQAARYLHDIEMQLVYALQPELNTHGKTRLIAEATYTLIFGAAGGISDLQRMYVEHDRLCPLPQEPA